MKGRSVKARLVARGFQEPNEHIIKKMSGELRQSTNLPASRSAIYPH